MRRYGYIIGPLLGFLLPALVILVVAVRTGEMPRVVSVWPLLVALGASVATWWLQGLVVAVLARPHLASLRVKEMCRVYMAGTFVALVSPIRGAEIPYEVYLLKRLGLSSGEGSNVVVTRVLLDAAVLTSAALVALALYSPALPEVQDPKPLLAVLAAAVILAAIAFLLRRAVRGRARRNSLHRGPGWQAKAEVKISGFLRDLRRSFVSYWRQGHRATLAYAVALATVYWVLRLCAGPLALMAVGWSGDWMPVVVAQLLLASFVLPFVPTPGGGGARELGLAALLSGHVPEGQLLSGLVVHTALTHWLPLIVGAFFAGHELRRGVPRRRGERKAAVGAGHAGTIARVMPTVAHDTPPRSGVSSDNPKNRGDEYVAARQGKLPKVERIPGGGMSKSPATTRFFNALGRRVAYFYVRRLMRSDIEWGPDLPSGAKIIAANHPTTTDPFLMMSWPFEPIYILISEAAFEVPLVGRFLRLAGHVPVYAHRGREAFEAALRLLGEGKTVGIFPEGALSEKDGRLAAARSGAVRLAATARVPIVPAGIAPDWHFVTARRWRRPGVTEEMRWFWLGTYEVSVGKPLVFEHAADDREAVERSTDVLRGEIERLMQRSAERLLGASWPLTTGQREPVTGGGGSRREDR